MENDGLYRTNDDGDSWFKVCDILVDSGVGNIIYIDHNDYNKIYIRTEYGLALVLDTLVSPLSDKKKKYPLWYSLSQNYPNPFNPTTQISFSLPKPGHVLITIHTTIGEKIETLLDKNMMAGTHKLTFDASHLSSGIYYYRIQAGEFESAKKMVFLK